MPLPVTVWCRGPMSMTNTEEKDAHFPVVTTPIERRFIITCGFGTLLGRGAERAVGPLNDNISGTWVDSRLLSIYPCDQIVSE